MEHYSDWWYLFYRSISNISNGPRHYSTPTSAHNAAQSSTFRNAFSNMSRDGSHGHTTLHMPPHVAAANERWQQSSPLDRGTPDPRRHR